MTKPIFIPLNSKPYEQFEAGTKPEEFRRYGARWNEGTCTVGRAVTLSKGFGKKHRLQGTVTHFKMKWGNELAADDQRAVIECFGTIHFLVAVIGIAVSTD
jgi:hypothetical protein